MCFIILSIIYSGWCIWENKLPYINFYFLTWFYIFNYWFAVSFIGESKNFILFVKKNGYNSISMKCPEEANLQRQQDSWLVAMSGWVGCRERGVVANGCGFSLGDNKYVLKLFVVVVVQCWIYEKPDFKWGRCMYVNYVSIKLFPKKWLQFEKHTVILMKAWDL